MDLDKNIHYRSLLPSLCLFFLLPLTSSSLLSRVSLCSASSRTFCRLSVRAWLASLACSSCSRSNAFTWLKPEHLQNTWNRFRALYPWDLHLLSHEPNILSKLCTWSHHTSLCGLYQLLGLQAHKGPRHILCCQPRLEGNVRDSFIKSMSAPA